MKHIVAAIIVCLFGSVSSIASATNYFNWDVETNTTSTGPVNGYNGGTTRDCTVSHGGSCSMRLNVIGNDSGNQGMGADIDQITLPFNVVGGPAIYYRWWMRIMPGFSWGSGTAKTKSNRVLGVTYPRVYTGYVQADGFNIGECDDVGASQPGGGCVDPGPTISYDMRAKNDGIWHEYVVMVKPNTTTGATDAEFKAWIDGTLVGQVLNWRLHNKSGNGFIEAWGGWMVYPYFQLNGTASDGGTIYVDDFSTDNVWNSTYSGGPDTTPPSLSAGLPSGEQAYGTTQVTMQVTTDENATCKYGSSSGVAYASMASTFSTTGGTSHSTTISGLSNGGSYTRYVRCIDGASNANTSDYSISWTVAASQPAQDCPSNWKSLHPTWIYCDDFETDKSSLWVDSNYYGSRMVRSSGNGYSGTYSMRATFPSAPSAASNGGDFMVSFGASPVSPTVDAADTTKYRELYWRAYIKTQAGWQPGTGQKLTRATSFHNSNWAQSMIAHWWGSSASPENTLQADPASGVCQGGVYPAGSPSCVNNTVITTGWNDFNGMYWLGGGAGTTPVLGASRANTWQCIEGYVKLNDSGQSNGVQTLWVDGVQDATKTGLNFVGTYSTYGINIFRVENYANSGTTNAQYRDWDNLVLSSERVGCTVGGSDSTPPSVTIATTDPSTISADSLTATGTASDGTGVIGCKWRIGSAPNASNGTACTGTTSFSCSTSGYSIGSNALHVGCYDAAGNYGTDSITVSYPCKKLATPSGLSFVGLVANPPSNATLSFDWSDVTTHADGSALTGDLANYRTYWGTVSGGPYNTSSAASSQISVGPTQANITYYARVSAESSVNSICNGDQTAEISMFADTVPPVLSGLNPSGNYPKTAANVALGVTTNEAAACRYGSAGSSWASKTAFSTTGATSHSSTLAVWAGLVKRICYQCRDALLNESAESCTTFSVSAKQKVGGFN